MQRALRALPGLLAVGAAACAPSYTWNPAAGAPTAAPRAAGEVTFYEGTEGEVLPRGVELGPQGLGVTVSPPHRRLGTLVHECKSTTWYDDDRGKMIAEAARRGANALVSAGSCQFVAVEVVAADGPAADAVLEAQARRAAGRERIAVEARQLDRFEGVTVAGRRGTCYAVGFALDGDAGFAAASTTHHGARWIGVPRGGDDAVVGRGWVVGDDYVIVDLAPRNGAEGLSESELCLAADRALTVQLGPPYGPRAEDRVSLGRGGVKIAVYARAAGPGELEAEIARQREGRARDEERRDRERRRACVECGAHTQECRARGAHMAEACDRYYGCLKEHGATVADCPD